jgi:hypothetical protein
MHNSSDMSALCSGFLFSLRTPARAILTRPTLHVCIVMRHTHSLVGCMITKQIRKATERANMMSRRKQYTDLVPGMGNRCLEHKTIPG